ncbi:hypothetical protein [Plantactinospora sp. WMMB782]|uniref:hypothetical protein n=1 Tax=Plantactinospora sp. WMMB782 TaxID=3404121 RepID=UPI003B92894F
MADDLPPDVKAAHGLCTNGDCTRPGVVTVSRSSVRVSFRIDHAQLPAWADRLRCWTCAGAELDALIAAATPIEVKP